jgi:hypothetical protein
MHHCRHDQDEDEEIDDAEDGILVALEEREVALH